MYRPRTVRILRSGGGFAEVPQTDTEADDGQYPRRLLRESSHERRTSDQFRQQVQNLLQQGTFDGDPETQSLHSSPALSDHTLISDDYLEVHSRGLINRNYVEYEDYYAPQPTHVSPTDSLKAGLGIEVRPASASSDTTIGEGLYLDDDPLAHISYRGSEGNIEQQYPRDIPDYKPAILRKWYLLALIAVLIILLALAELTVHLLPDVSGKPTDEADQNSEATQMSSRSSGQASGFIGEPKFSLLRARQHHYAGGKGSNATSPEAPIETTASVTSDISFTSVPQTTTTLATELTTSASTNEPSSTDDTVTDTEVLPQPTIPTTTSTTTSVVENPSTTKLPGTTETTTPANTPPGPPFTVPKTRTEPVLPEPPLFTEKTTTTPTETGPTPPLETMTPPEHTNTNTPNPPMLTIDPPIPGKPTGPDQGGTEPAPTNTIPKLPLPTPGLPTIQTAPNAPDPQPPGPEPTTNPPQLTKTNPASWTQDPGTTTIYTTKPPVETQPDKPTDKPSDPTSADETKTNPGPTDILTILPVDLPEPTTAAPATHEFTILPINIPTTTPDEPATGKLTILPVVVPTTTNRDPTLPDHPSTTADILAILPINTDKPPPNPPPSLPTPTAQPPTIQTVPDPPLNPPGPTSQPTTPSPHIDLPTQPHPGPPPDTPTDRPTDLPPETSLGTKPPLDEPPQTQRPPRPNQGDQTKGYPTDDQAIQEQATNRPAQEEPTNEPAQEPANQPTRGQPTNQPTQEQPTNQATQEQPTNQATQEQPTNQATQEQPTDHPAQERPITTQPIPTKLNPETTPTQTPTGEAAHIPAPSPLEPSTPAAKSPSATTPPLPTTQTSSPSTHVKPDALILLTSSVSIGDSLRTSKVLLTSEAHPTQTEEPTSGDSETATEAAQPTFETQDGEELDPFSVLVPFTTLVLTEPTPTPQLSPTTTGTAESSTTDYPTTMNDFGLGQKFLQSALTYYTPVEGGHTKDPFWAYRNVITAVDTGTDGKPIKTQTLAKLYGSQTSVLTDYQGRPTSTVTYYVVPHAKTLFDSHGHPTATTSFTASEVPMLYTLRNAKGIATATVTSMVPMSSSTVVQVVTATPTSATTAGDPGKTGQEKSALRVSDAQYFGVLMLPTLLAVALAIPIRILDRTAKLYQPFHAMTSKRGVIGAPASESLCLETRGLRSVLWTRFHSALNGQWLLSLTGTLVLASAVLIPLSGEMMHISFHCLDVGEEDNSSSNTPDPATANCAIMSPLAVTVLPHTARAVVGVLAFMALLLCIVFVALRRWTTGVARPWSLHYVAHLAANDDIQLLLRRARGRNGKSGKATATQERINRMFGAGDKAYFLGYWTENAMVKYGIQICNDEVGVRGTLEKREKQQPLRRNGVKGGGKVVTFESATKGRRRGKGGEGGAKKNERAAMPFFLLTFVGRSMFLAFLCAVLIFVLVYHVVGKGRIGWIMVGESIGVRILFTVLGVLIAIAWESFFYTVAFLSPFRLLLDNNTNNSHTQQDSRSKKHRAFHTTPPTNVLSGAWLALFPGPGPGPGRRRRPRDRDRDRDAYLGAVATAGIFAELLPLLLSNVPFEFDLDSAGICTWMSVAILCVLMVVVVASFLVRWPHMPVDPSTVAGAMYYASDPTLPSSATERERNVEAGRLMLGRGDGGGDVGGFV